MRLFGENPLTRFRNIGYLEGASLLILLFVAMPLKYVYAMPIAVRIVGTIHGVLFIAYVSLLAYIASEDNWPTKRSIMGFFAAMLPFGTFLYDYLVLREMQETDINQ